MFWWLEKCLCDAKSVTLVYMWLQVNFFNTYYSQLLLRSIGNVIVRYSELCLIIFDMILPGHMVMVRSLCCVYVWLFDYVVCWSWQMEEVTSMERSLNKILGTIYHWNTKIWKNFAKNCRSQNTKLQCISEFPHTFDIPMQIIL